MAEFKQSNLICKLEESAMLSQDAWDFIDACMDDFCVDESEEDGVTIYELRGTLTGWRNGKEVRVTQIYYADLSGIAALIEHLALTHMLLIEHIDKCIAEKNF
jgi:hypothetical protein